MSGPTHTVAHFRAVESTVQPLWREDSTPTFEGTRTLQQMAPQGKKNKMEIV